MTDYMAESGQNQTIDIVKSQLALPGHAHATGLDLPDHLTYEQWQGIGGALQSVNRSVMWWIGDWLRYGERRYGEMYAQAVEQTGRTYDSLSDAKWIAEAFQFSDRSENLSWTHHRIAAALPPNQRREILDLAERDGLSVRDMRHEVNRRKAAAAISAPHASNGTCTVADLWRLVEMGQKFGAIYADPPWVYDNQGTRAATGNHYGGLTVEELCDLPVDQLAADDAHLHLWTTNAFLFECPKLFDAWGFEFRSSFVWVKPQMGIGNYWRNSHEFMLTAIRGNAKRFNDKSLMSWLQCDRGRHSAKPERVRQYIERASAGPYLEMFGRAPAQNWTVWGNQIERSMFFPEVREII